MVVAPFTGAGTAATASAAVATAAVISKDSKMNYCRTTAIRVGVHYQLYTNSTLCLSCKTKK